MIIGIKGYKEKGTSAAQYLRAEVEGGRRAMKGSETLLMRKGYLKEGQALLPGPNIRLNGNGNVPAGMYQKILSALDAQSDRGQNTKAYGKQRNKTTQNIFFAKMGSTTGIYQRGPRESLALLFRVTDTPTYRIQFPFTTIASKSAQRHVGKAFKEAIEFTLKNIK